MESLADYDILNDDSSRLSSTFLVRHKLTGERYCLQSISLNDLNDNEQKALLKKINIRINLKHPNILQFYDHIQHEDIIYLKQEHCEYGTLTQFIQKECIQKDRQLHENLLCRLLYQTVFALKTVECFMGQLNMDSILLDEEYNIKLYNFVKVDSTNKNQKQKEVKMSQLGILIYELCTLKPFEKNFENELQLQSYTDAFKGLLVSMIKDSTEIKKHINKILCHPTVLLHSSQWNKDCCFVENPQQILKKSSSSDLSENMAQDYSERLDKLRRKEAALQIKEQLLKEQERRLINKEKKIQIMERTVKDKLQQAELYLKRCREGGKSISSGSSKSSSQSSVQSKMSYDNADPNYVSCGDSDVFPTSTKLQVDKIVKPQSFTRTMSERRIRFKTSPLKDHNFARKAQARKSLRHSKILEEHTDIIENAPPKSQINQFKERRKTLFISSNEYENDFMTINSDYERAPCDVNNVGWTEETKKYAFDMLRMMNGDEKENFDIKHTNL